MDYRDYQKHEKLNFSEMPPGTFLLGLLSAFENKYQAKADQFFKEITWKQMFAVACTLLFKERPTLSELAEVIGSSRQNVKQILLKLERKGFVNLVVDEADRRIQRIIVTDACFDFFERHEEMSNRISEKLFEGVTEAQIMTTIETLLQLERNLERNLENI